MVTYFPHGFFNNKYFNKYLWRTYYVPEWTQLFTKLLHFRGMHFQSIIFLTEIE